MNTNQQLNSAISSIISNQLKRHNCTTEEITQEQYNQLEYHKREIETIILDIIIDNAIIRDELREKLSKTDAQ